MPKRKSPTLETLYRECKRTETEAEQAGEVYYRAKRTHEAARERLIAFIGSMTTASSQEVAASPPATKKR